MGSRGYESVLRGFDALFGAGAIGARPDGELIESFLGRGDAAEAAFAGLVERHGPMVLRVCRGELRDAHAAEDAFQATFLILARKAGAIREAGSIASWLYGVARRVARRARAVEGRRAGVERRGAIMAAERRPGAIGTRELVPEIQEEIDRLPEKYRTAIVLCDLEGLSREEAAGQLLVPAGTVRIRLARGRLRLRGRLARRGLAPGIIAAAAADARAEMPTMLVDATIRAAMRIAAGRAAGASGPVAALVEGVFKAMFLTKLKSAALLTMAAAAACLAAIPLLGALPGPRPGDGPAPTSKAGDAGQSVVVAAVTASNVARTTSQVGSVFPFEAIDVYAKSPGIVKSQEVDIGDAVKRGQVLAALDVPGLMSDVDQAMARVEQAKARLDQVKSAVAVAEASAEADAAQLEASTADLAAAEATLEYRRKQFDRLKGLAARNAIDERLVDEAMPQLEAAKSAPAAAKAKRAAAASASAAARARVVQAKADVQVAQADVRVAEAALTRAKMLAGQATITAPIDGVVTRRNFHPGDFVRSGDQPGAVPLLTIVRADRVRVVVGVAERDAMLLKRGSAATVRLDSLDGHPYEGTISRMAYAIDSARTLRAEIDIDNRDGRLRPGQFGTVTIDLDPARRRLVIPAAALLAVQPGGTADCVRVRDGRAALTRIKFAPLDGGRVEVVEGLSEGDRVVVDAPAGLKDGQAIAPRDGRRP